GGGVPYAAFPHFHALQREMTAAYFDAALVEGILPLAPDLVEKLTVGGDVLDIGCGAGHALSVLAKAFPNSHFTGYDFESEAIALARKEAAEQSLSNVGFEVRDVA